MRFRKGTKLPALLSMHGGGQSAWLDSVVADAQRGYAGTFDQLGRQQAELRPLAADL